jgi:hypothetical protein
MLKKIFTILCFLFSCTINAQLNLSINCSLGTSKRNVLYNTLSDTAENIIKNNELPSNSFNALLGIEKKLYKRIWLYNGIGYYRCSFKTKQVRFAPYYVSQGYADSTGYQIETIDKTIAFPINIGYHLFENKSNTISIYTGIDILYKLDQKVKFAIKPIYENTNWTTAKGVYHVKRPIYKSYKLSTQIPIRVNYFYNINKIGFGINLQYAYVLGKTYTLASDSGYGYIGVKEETAGRISFLNIGISLIYKCRK